MSQLATAHQLISVCQESSNRTSQQNRELIDKVKDVESKVVDLVTKLQEAERHAGEVEMVANERCAKVTHEVQRLFLQFP